MDETRGSDLTRALAMAALFAAVAVIGLLVLAATQPEPVTGEVLRTRVANDGTIVATVRFHDTTHRPPATRTATVELPPALVDNEVVPVWPGDDDNPPRVDNWSFEATAGWLGLTAAIAVLLGLVVSLSLAGFGFVPGTGRYGETDPEHVKESHGFYWRT